MSELNSKNAIIAEGNSLIKGLRHNPFGVKFDESIYISIRTAVDMLAFNNDELKLHKALLKADDDCAEVYDTLNNLNKTNRRPKVLNTLAKFRNLLDKEITVLRIKSADLRLGLENSSVENDITFETEKLSRHLQQYIDDSKRAKSEVKAFIRDLEQRTLDRTDRILEESELSLRNRLNEGHDNIRSTVQSVRDELDIYTNRAENKIKKLVTETERKNQIFHADLKNLFDQYEKDSTNRIEVRIQRAEGLAANLSKQATEAKEQIQNVVSEEEESLQTILFESRSTVNEAIRRASTEAAQKVQTAQTDAQESFSAFVSEHIESIDKRIERKIADYDDLKVEMEKTYREKVNELESHISIVTSAVMANENLKQAKTENRVYWGLQALGMVFMIAAIYSGSAFFSELTNIRLPFFPKPDLVIHVDGASSSARDATTLMFMRLSMIILLTAPAIYLLKEAAVHRHKENLYRQEVCNSQPYRLT
ncbi:hypothetical protein [Vibrio coralliilyticus]|uniref:hypothetical protein n=1 Tax=Vibrio coralliilyticus TaxID=190893 RepID=UPI00240A559D|nr:hypothetical protein [Vibrio coralliilyticus]WFB49880.1 hypothetical protein P6988_23865 [Vibrio coralliilyticus]